MLFNKVKRRNRKVSPKHKFYEGLRVFREKMEAKGFTRGDIRRERRLQRTLFPVMELLGETC